MRVRGVWSRQENRKREDQNQQNHQTLQDRLTDGGGMEGTRNVEKCVPVMRHAIGPVVITSSQPPRGGRARARVSQRCVNLIGKH